MQSVANLWLTSAHLWQTCASLCTPVANLCAPVANLCTPVAGHIPGAPQPVFARLHGSLHSGPAWRCQASAPGGAAAAAQIAAGNNCFAAMTFLTKKQRSASFVQQLTSVYIILPSSYGVPMSLQCCCALVLCSQSLSTTLDHCSSLALETLPRVCSCQETHPRCSVLGYKHML